MPSLSHLVHTLKEREQMSPWERLRTLGASRAAVAASADRIDEVDRISGPLRRRRQEPAKSEVLAWLGYDRPAEKETAPAADQTTQLVRRYLQANPELLRQLVREVLADDLPAALAYLLGEHP